jgi:hypothetical protein
MSKKISIALLFAKMFQWLSLIIYGLFVLLVICVAVKPELTTDYVLQMSKGAELFQITKCKDCQDSGLTVHINRLDFNMLLWIFLKLTAIMTLIFMINRELMKVLRNFKSLGTFYEGNIKSFRKIGLWFALLAVLYAFRYLTYFNEDGKHAYDHVMYNVPFGLVALALGSYLLSEVFKEGRQLQEDKESIL